VTAPELPELPELTDDEAVAEVGWIAREARRLIEVRDLPAAAWSTFYRRKARLLAHIASRPGVLDPDAAAQMIAKAERLAEQYEAAAAADLPVAVDAAGRVDLSEQLPPTEGMHRRG
jgi:hypothetical protein